MVDFSSEKYSEIYSEKYSVLLDTGTPVASREIYIGDADDETQTHNPSVINQVLHPLW